ncbi:MAG: glycogen debranching enzyme, partial [Actinopolymorphaceae bacterium]
PMVLHGDELGRTQHGNNNAYAQDNDMSWVSWVNADSDLLAFTRTVSQLRAEHPVFRRRRFFDGLGSGDGVGDVGWLKPDGTDMTGRDWTAGFAKSLTVFLNGEAIREPGRQAERIVDDSFLLLFNASEDDLEFTVPGAKYGEAWEPVLDTADDDLRERVAVLAGERLKVISRSLVVLKRV